MLQGSAPRPPRMRSLSIPLQKDRAHHSAPRFQRLRCLSQAMRRDKLLASANSQPRSWCRMSCASGPKPQLVSYPSMALGRISNHVPPRRRPAIDRQARNLAGLSMCTTRVGPALRTSVSVMMPHETYWRGHRCAQSGRARVPNEAAAGCVPDEARTRILATSAEINTPRGQLRQPRD